MNEFSKTTLEQWRALQALNDCGSLVEAADLLGKSQSTLSYLLAQLQEALGVSLLGKEGRRTILNDNGLLLLDRAKGFLSDIDDAEFFARLIGSGREPVIRLAIDTATPLEFVTETLRHFNERSKGTRLELHEAVMSGVNQLLMNREIDVAIGLTPPPGFAVEPLMGVDFRLVCAACHPLATLPTVTVADCENEVQVVVRDSGPQDLDRGWLSPKNRWSVSNLRVGFALIEQGLCFGRLPCHMIKQEIDAGSFVELNVMHASHYTEQLYLTRAHRGAPGKATADLLESVRETALSYLAASKQ